MRALSAAQRAQDIARLTRDGVDVVVIGGGITGAGIALDAATRGYSVGLVEKDDFASGTSSWSTKLVHGGIRYLPQGDIGLVREALIERGRLLNNAPHLAHPLTFVLPLYASSRRPVGLPIAVPGGIGLGAILDIGLTLYDRLAGGANVREHHRIASAEVVRLAPMLRPEGLRGGFLYVDGQTDDSRLTLAILRSAAEVGAALVNHAAVTGFTRDEHGRLASATLCLNAPGEADVPVSIRARHIINATGIFAERIEALTGGVPRLRIEPSKGVHLVLRAETLKIGRDAVVLPETEDGRIIFLVPWRSRVIVGTTDTGTGDLDRPIANDEDVDYLLTHINRSLRFNVTRADILSTYAGYRPLLRLRDNRTPARLSRTHAIVEGEGGLLTISGGKLTTYRSMAQGLVDRIDARMGVRNACVTQGWPLAGAVGWPASIVVTQRRGAALGVSALTCVYLASTYGALADEVLDLIEANPTLIHPLDPELPTIMAEVVYAVRAEGALTITDVLERRLHLAIESADHGVGIAPLVATLLATELGWSDTDIQTQLADYSRYVTIHDGGLARVALGRV